MGRRLFGAAGALVALLIGTACGNPFATKIGRITAEPGAFDGRTVTVAGEVTGRVNLALVKFFRLRDESGEITVVTEGSLPREGDKVRVKGTVKQAFALGDLRAVVIVEAPPDRR
jgi:aspartyl/asparaginyl-tRNA synthetase